MYFNIHRKTDNHQRMHRAKAAKPINQQHSTILIPTTTILTIKKWNNLFID
jgi:hypothetical protein